MPLLNDITAEDRTHPKTVEVRQSMGPVEFARHLQMPPPEVHALAVAAFKAGNRAIHDELIHIGWLRNRYLLRTGL